jgi:hypothetical protein
MIAADGTTQLINNVLPTIVPELVDYMAASLLSGCATAGFVLT